MGFGTDFHKITHNSISNDERYTPSYALEPLLPYIPSGSIVWCPFDTDKSHLVEALKGHGCTVINTHIDYGQDFFEIDVPMCNYIISNPPYSIKTEVFEKLFKIGKPFAMLVGVVGLFEAKRYELFSHNRVEVMYLDKRVDYYIDYNDTKQGGSAPFSSVWLCSNVLPNQIEFGRINKH